MVLLHNYGSFPERLFNADYLTVSCFPLGCFTLRNHAADFEIHIFSNIFSWFGFQDLSHPPAIFQHFPTFFPYVSNIFYNFLYILYNFSLHFQNFPTFFPHFPNIDHFTAALQVALCELASDSGAAELAALGLKRQRWEMGWDEVSSDWWWNGDDMVHRWCLDWWTFFAWWWLEHDWIIFPY